MTVSAGWLKARRRLIGIVFLATFALLIWLSLAIYNKQFTPVSMVTLYTSSAGNEMNIGAQVMVRGVQVGEVRQITANGHGARLELAIDPRHGAPAARQRDRADAADHAVRGPLRGPDAARHGRRRPGWSAAA